MEPGTSGASVPKHERFRAVGGSVGHLERFKSLEWHMLAIFEP